ncbi:uncharacterized protein LOC105205483 [Solenopsis invicta]|uniref:uncharacterized protein LOC105205483 n=1 Tax=Solenopsis invicta TaxID=13686 RepID=UPI00193DE571|nr:uncharacterized protein LOC105205483 [Solenopsis invicta]
MLFCTLFRISLKEFLQSFHRFNEDQIYLTDLTFSIGINESNDVDEICADMLSETPTIDRNIELNENRSTLTNSRNMRRRSRRRITHFPSENSRGAEVRSEFHEDQNSTNNNIDEHDQHEQTITTHFSSGNIGLEVTTSNEMFTPENTDSPEMTETLSEIPDENVFAVPEDDYGYIYKGRMNASEESIPYHPVERNIDTSSRSRRSEGKKEKNDKERTKELY